MVNRRRKSLANSGSQIDSLFDGVDTSKPIQKKEKEINLTDKNIEDFSLEEKRKFSLNKVSRKLNIKFSKEQENVILHSGKPLNVMSGAGSGKTTVLVNKMFVLEDADKVKPLNMLAITYNKDAQLEIEARYKKNRKQLGFAGKYLPTFKTYHSLFNMLLKSDGQYKNTNIVSESQYNFQLLRLIQNDGVRDNKEILDEILKHRSTLINKSISTDGLTNAIFEDVKFSPTNYKTVIEKYESLKRTDNVIDFDDMQVLLLKELNSDNGNEIISRFQNIFKYVFIDEYQDISKLQLDIMDILISDYNKLTTIGDDDQSIYGFRGSEPKYIRDFVYRYPNAERLFLGTNYRCKSNILNPVIPSINRNDDRVKKELSAFNEGGTFTTLPITQDLNQLANTIKEDIEFMEDTNPDFELEDIAILVRLNSQRMLLADNLIANGVQIDIGSMNYSLRKNKIYKTAIKILSAIKEEDNIGFSEVSNIIFPSLNSSVSRKYKKEAYVNWYEEIILDDRYSLPESILDAVKKIKETNNARNCMGYIWTLTRDYYEKLAKRGNYNFQNVLDVYKHLLRITNKTEVSKFIKREQRKERQLEALCGSNAGVQIKTLHSVKGLEFPKVYLVGVDGDKFPNEAHIDRLYQSKGVESVKSYIEEERRLFYVGATRAVNDLTISYNVENPSAFLFELEGLELNGITNNPLAKKHYFQKLGVVAKPLDNLNIDVVE